MGASERRSGPERKVCVGCGGMTSGNSSRPAAVWQGRDAPELAPLL